MNKQKLMKLIEDLDNLEKRRESTRSDSQWTCTYYGMNGGCYSHVWGTSNGPKISVETAKKLAESFFNDHHFTKQREYVGKIPPLVNISMLAMGDYLGRHGQRLRWRDSKWEELEVLNFKL